MTAESSTADEPNGSQAPSNDERYERCTEPGAAPDCPVRFGDCDIHHLKEWNQGGPTNLANLIPLCSRAPPPHPRRPLAPTSPSTRRIKPAAAGRPTASGATARQGTRPSPPPLQERFSHRAAAPAQPMAVPARSPSTTAAWARRGATQSPTRCGPARRRPSGRGTAARPGPAGTASTTQSGVRSLVGAGRVVQEREASCRRSPSARGRSTARSPWRRRGSTTAPCRA